MIWPSTKKSSTSQNTNLEPRTQQIGRELLAQTRAISGPGALSKAFWSDKLINWALQDEAFKTQLFRFVDVFPVLTTPDAIHQHLVEYLQQPGVKLPPGFSLGLKAGGLLKGTLARTVASQIESLAATFIAGQDVAAALPILESRWRDPSAPIAFSVDLLGEACVSHAEAQIYRQRYLDLITQLCDATASWPANPTLESDHLGPLPRVNVSIKISALDGHISPVDAGGSIDRLILAMEPLLTLAARRNVLINFDMEHHALKELTFTLFKRCCQKFDFPAGIALQAYLRSAEEDVRDLITWAQKSNRLITMRLIKGAYWDFDTIHARLMNWPAPVWQKKYQTDACFERCTTVAIQQLPQKPNQPGVKLALGTHNIRSVAHAIAAVEAAGLPQNALEFQCLRGMAHELKATLAQQKWRIREYQPIGQMIPGMAYLVRRLLENTSNEGWVRAGQSGEISDDQLLAQPVPDDQPDSSKPDDHDFHNEPPRDFSQSTIRESFRSAITTAHVPQISIDRTVGHAHEAITKALAAYPDWRARTDRSDILRRAAASLRNRRDHLAGVMIKESAKTWAEADADVCEAIDFCEFYARQAEQLLTPRQLGQLPGEHNLELHQPRGVAAIISPWNFPLAIATGMTVAALVAGNTAILKPAEQTPAIASLLCSTLWQAGIPREALHFLPGPGETVGAELVRDPRVAAIAFTGSAAVGLDILHAAHTYTSPPSILKRVITEMGGKNAIIIDESADLDEAVLAVRQSAFGFAGQKCSACSRVIALDPVHDRFVARLIESTRALIAGDPLDPATDLGPVIDAEAAAKIRQYIDIGKSKAALAFPESSAIKDQESKIKNLIEPHIFTNVQPTHRIAREEIFGPVLAILRAKDFTHALQIANDLPYKLTGGVFSRTPSHLARARDELNVGNLYLNRGITGALVGRQPFGGLGLSGVGAKAGGTDYLRQFTDTRNITENTLRRGFAPEES